MGFGSQRVFDGFDLEVRRGERLAILGSSGCGKSTLLRCIAGLEVPQAGTIAVNGALGFVFQEPRLFPWLSVERNVAFAARNAAERERVAELLALVDLTAARAKLPKELSGGMAQRAALARALVRRPDIVLLDEPLAALDALRRLELRAALRDIIAAAGASAILVTHDVDEALDVGTRCLVLERTTLGVRSSDPLGDGATHPDPRRVLLEALGVQASPAIPAATVS
jgi:sulfonate transport system ATP-binding protein